MSRKRNEGEREREVIQVCSHIFLDASFRFNAAFTFTRAFGKISCNLAPADVKKLYFVSKTRLMELQCNCCAEGRENSRLDNRRHRTSQID
jgi:hypothetical protein